MRRVARDVPGFRHGRRSRLTGFTLLELLMVVVIIAILASIAVPQYFKAVEKARAADAISYLGTLRTAQIQYRAGNSSNQYTNNLANLDIDLAASLTNWGTPSLSAPGTTGVATFTRNSGTYAGETLGIRYGSGALCGNFAPLALSQQTCVAD